MDLWDHLDSIALAYKDEPEALQQIITTIVDNCKNAKPEIKQKAKALITKIKDSYAKKQDELKKTAEEAIKQLDPPTAKATDAHYKANAGVFPSTRSLSQQTATHTSDETPMPKTKPEP